MKEIIEKNEEKFLSELFNFLKIPSISADKAYSDAVFEAADFVADKLGKAGAENVEIFQTPGYPVVYGDRIIDESLPTVLVYGHYDVQPPDPLELWGSPPFEPVIKNGKIYARGASDDKGQMYMHIKALEVLQENGDIPCNIKFMFEGEEEVGSDNLENFVIANKEKLQADVILISDTGILSNENPSITTGLRGLSYVEVKVTGPDKDLHSGMFGGQVANPVNVLCEMIASLKDENNKVTIPGFYDNVAEVSPEERAEMAKAPFDEDAYKKSIGVNELDGEKGYTTLERVAIRPTLDVNGIWGGYIGQGAKTVLPSIAQAKISMRLVPNQSSEEITEKFTKHFESIAPTSVKVEVTPHHGGEPAVTPTDSVAYKAASNAMRDSFGKDPIPMREGGSIPIVALFEKELGLKTVLMGFGLDEDAIHSPNESYGIFNFKIGIETICRFYKYYAELMSNNS